MNHGNEFLKVLFHYAPTGDAQEKCVQLFHAISAAGEEDRKIDLEMAETIATGLRYGNWPWTSYSDLPKTSTQSIECLNPRGYFDEVAGDKVDHEGAFLPRECDHIKEANGGCESISCPNWSGQL